MQNQHDVKQRFTNRVDHYMHFRPGYGDQVLPFLTRETVLTNQSVIADIGSGTGALAGIFLAGGCRVFGIEPNKAMRDAGESLLSSYEKFTSIAASAEDTGLDDHSIDVVTVGSAFHWFDPAPAKTEFLRILAPGGWLVIIGNSRKKDEASASAKLDALLEQFAIDDSPRLHAKEARAQRIRDFYEDGSCRMQSFDQSFFACLAESMDVFRHRQISERMV